VAAWTRHPHAANLSILHDRLTREDAFIDAGARPDRGGNERRVERRALQCSAADLAVPSFDANT